jgi:hypothetical protein
MFHCIVFLLFAVVFNNICLVVSWNPSNFTFNPGDNYELVWQDAFENVGPARAIIRARPYYMILNISIRGQKPGPPDNTTVWPQEMVVDWVRIY